MSVSATPARPVALALYTVAVAVAGVTSLTVGSLEFTWDAGLDTQMRIVIGFLGIVAIGAEVVPMRLFREGAQLRSLSLASPAVLPILAIAGTVPAIVVQVVATLIADTVHRHSWDKRLFNASQYAISIFVAGSLYEPVAAAAGTSHSGWAQAQRIGALALAGTVMIALNWILASIEVRLEIGTAIRTTLRSEASGFASTHLVLLCLGAISADIAPHGVLGVALLAIPISVAQRYANTAVRHAHDAAHDALTGLRNRAQVHVELPRAVQSARDAGVDGPAVVLLDLDHFKDVNDTLGHAVGDEVLRQVAQRLTEAAPDGASVHRLGGDEFAAIMPFSRSQAREPVAALLRALDAPIAVDGLELYVRASAGVAVAPQDGDDVDTLFKCADIALYHAKIERGRISFYRPEHDRGSRERLQLLTDLRGAISRGEIRVVYQPQLDLECRCVVAVEALARWTHPVHGPVPADVFVQLAESSGLIFGLTDAVLDASLAQAARWRAEGHAIRMSVNLSARHLADLGLPDQVDRALRRHGVPADALVLEITETAILSDAKRADTVLRALRGLGVAIAIDDYGTGNASLGYLKSLEIDELKIDRSFVARIGEEPHALAIVRSTIALALELGLRVVAEGIEDEASAVTLQELGAVVGQGYHLGRPAPAERIGAELRAARGASAELARR